MNVGRSMLIRTVGTCIALGAIAGCNWMEKHPRTAGTVGGAAAGAAVGASVDDEDPGRGAVVGGAIGAGAGNVGGKVYKDAHD
jgi:hypothetical protein